MGFVLRLYRVAPLIFVLVVLAVLLYLILSFRLPNARAKQIVLNVFLVIMSVLTAFCALATLYAVLDGNMFGVELFASCLAVAVLGLVVTLVLNHQFLKLYPQYKDKAVRAHIVTWFEKVKNRGKEI